MVVFNDALMETIGLCENKSEPECRLQGEAVPALVTSNSLGNGRLPFVEECELSYPRS